MTSIYACVAGFGWEHDYNGPESGMSCTKLPVLSGDCAYLGEYTAHISSGFPLEVCRIIHEMLL